MKKILFAFLLLIINSFLLTSCFNEKVDMSFAKNGTAVFKNDDFDVKCKIDDNDFEEIKHLFNKKTLYSDNPSCGFSKDIAVVFNDSQTFCFARDTCPTVFWKEKNKYFDLSEKEKNELYDILKKYGFFFPCV